MALRQDLRQHLAAHIGQAVVATVEAVGQLRVFQTHELE